MAWIGDYANSESYDDESGYNGHISLKELDKLHRIAYNDKKIEKGLTKVDFDMQDKFLVNHDKKEYVDLNKYKKNSTMKGGWCIHPLSILTCYGNGLGGGDYNCPTDDSTIEFVGAWGWDLIEITDDAPESYTEVNVIFKEKGWE